MVNTDLDTIILLSYFSAGAVLVVLGLPLYFGKVPPNRLYGFRSHSTQKTPKVWYAVNRVAGRGMILTGAISTALALGLLWLEFPASQKAVINFAVFAAGLAGTWIHSAWTARKHPT